MNADRVGVVLLVAAVGGFVVGLAVVSSVLPDPSGGPMPPGTRIASYALFASFFTALAAIPLAMWFVDRRAGERPAVAYPPHDLRQCFAEYRGNGQSGITRHICESGLLNRPLGSRRLNEGLVAGLVLIVLTAVVAMRLSPPGHLRHVGDGPRPSGDSTRP